MSLEAAVIELAALAVRPAWMPHGVVLSGCRSIIKNSSRPSFSQANLAGLEGLPTSEVHGLCLESWSPFCISIYSIENAGVPLAPCCCCCEGFE